MALATIISASLSISLHNGGIPALTTFLWAMWWLDVALSMASCIILPYVMCVLPCPRDILSNSNRIARHTHSIEQQNAAWLLPVVPPIVASSLGAVLCNALIDTDPQKAIITVAASCGMLAIGLSLAIMLVGHN